ncbi:uncharacterized protein LOC132939398 isoform X2 [Metopolophium dirhodum]|uniref:uncharacterized protein LOC132939398 isoform X2 n=1 Tax=Metopolophium dirhodum TaxID=44670 RepID=UPI002990571F|nr:uncharacterized protein LOC132939398 isoform X2 [Metopolophium dirhodum]
MVNKMLAFCFMFYFISSTLARSELKLAKCREQMMNATLLAKRMVNEVLTVFSRAKPIYDYWVVPSWQNTVTAFVVPLCTYIHSHEENNKEDQKGTKYDLNDIFSTCQIQNKYKSDRREAPTYCTFLLGYRNNTQTMYPGNVFNVDNFAFDSSIHLSCTINAQIHYALMHSNIMDKILTIIMMIIHLKNQNHFALNTAKRNDSEFIKNMINLLPP